MWNGLVLEPALNYKEKEELKKKRGGCREPARHQKEADNGDRAGDSAALHFHGTYDPVDLPLPEFLHMHMHPLNFALAQLR